MNPIRVWITGRPNGQGYLASVAMDVEISGGFLIQISGMRLIETKEKKIVLVMPNVKDAAGKWKTVFSPLNQPTRDVLENAALDHWKRTWANERQGLRDVFEPID